MAKKRLRSDPITTPTPAPCDAVAGSVATGQAKSITFRASIPIKAAAIDIHGETGARLTLEIADSDLADFMPIVLFRGKRLRVTVAEDV